MIKILTSYITLFLFIIIYILDDYTPQFIINLFINIIKYNNIFILKFIQWIPSFIKKKNLEKCLEEIQENCLHHDFSYTKTIFQNNNINIDKDFIFFDKIPIASATIGQVYKAQLKTGELVAVKVKHPNIENQIINSSKWLDYYLNKFNNCVKLINNDYTININFSKFKISIQEECNFNKEANYLKLFNQRFDDTDFIIPKLYDNTNDYIIMSYETGTHHNDLGFNNRFIFSKLFIFFITNFICYDLAYTDFHSGNWRIKNDKLIMYDFGNIFNTNNKKYNLYFYITSVCRNYLELYDLLIIYSNKICSYDEYINTIHDLNKFKNNVIINNKKLNIDDFLKVIAKNNIHIDFSIILILKSILTINSFFNKFDVINYELPYLERTNQFINILIDKLNQCNIKEKQILYQHFNILNDNLNRFIFYEKFKPTILKFAEKNEIYDIKYIENHMNSIYNLFIINGISEDILDSKLTTIQNYLEDNYVFDRFYSFVTSKKSESFLKYKWNILNNFINKKIKIQNMIRNINDDNCDSIFNKIITLLKSIVKNKKI